MRVPENLPWQVQSHYVHITDTLPAYRVARFFVAGTPWYRPSFNGQFIGSPQSTVREARAICERHHKINQEARSHDDPERTSVPA